MDTQYREVARIQVTHSYYTNGLSKDFEYSFSEGTQHLLDQGRLIKRIQQGQLILYAAKNISNLGELTLAIGVVLRNPNFFNYTEPATSEGLKQFTNESDKRALTSSFIRSIVNQRFTHSVSSLVRPLTASLRVDGDVVVDKDDKEITYEVESDGLSEINVLLPEPNMGHFELLEKSDSEQLGHSYFSSHALSQQRVEALININLDASFINDPPIFSIDFESKEETLSYYVIAKNYSSEFDQLLISGVDTSVAGSSTPLTFTKITDSNFTAQHYTKDELGIGDDDKVVLFESDTKIRRHEKSKMNMQLLINGETLLKSLPTVGPERLTSDLFIYLSKPKT